MPFLADREIPLLEQALGYAKQYLETADSWAVDAHKTLNVPYDCGIVFSRDREALINSFRATGSYLHYSENREPMDYAPSMSKRARAIELWAILKTLGREGVADLVAQLCNHAKYFSKQLANAGFEIHNKVVFNQVVVSGKDDEETNEILRQVQASGECWCGGTHWRGRDAIRLSVCSWATTREDIDRSVTAFVKARDASRCR